MKFNVIVFINAKYMYEILTVHKNKFNLVSIDLIVIKKILQIPIMGKYKTINILLWNFVSRR